jgi:hypothetical protein
MDQAILAPPLAALAPPLPSHSAKANPMQRLPAVVRSVAADLLCATDTRIIKMGSDNDGGWRVEIEVFAPNPELTISMRGGVKAILERSRHRLHFDSVLQLIALEPAEE